MVQIRGMTQALIHLRSVCERRHISTQLEASGLSCLPFQDDQSPHELTWA